MYIQCIAYGCDVLLLCGEDKAGIDTNSLVHIFVLLTALYTANDNLSSCHPLVGLLAQHSVFLLLNIRKNRGHLL